MTPGKKYANWGKMFKKIKPILTSVRDSDILRIASKGSITRSTKT